MNPEYILRYAPYIYFDENEPFFPVNVAVSILKPGEASPSFARNVSDRYDNVDAIIEYAIYWDFDIQHLYELEHVWIYVGKDGEVRECEASFHGRYFKGLLKDRSNMEDSHVILYSQPGKHAFFPSPDYFHLLPNLSTCTDEDAGIGGLLIADNFRGKLSTNPRINWLVCNYLQKHYRFKPSMIFRKYTIPAELLTSWDALAAGIPDRIAGIIASME